MICSLALVLVPRRLLFKPLYIGMIVGRGSLRILQRASVPRMSYSKISHDWKFLQQNMQYSKRPRVCNARVVTNHCHPIGNFRHSVRGEKTEDTPLRTISLGYSVRTLRSWEFGGYLPLTQSRTFVSPSTHLSRTTCCSYRCDTFWMTQSAIPPAETKAPNSIDVFLTA